MSSQKGSLLGSWCLTPESSCWGPESWVEEEEGFSLGHFFTECHPAQEVGAAGATGGPGAYVLAEGEVGSTQVPWHGGYARGPTAHPFTPASFQSLSACSPILRPFVLALLCEKSPPQPSCTALGSWIECGQLFPGCYCMYVWVLGGGCMSPLPGCLSVLCSGDPRPVAEPGPL